MKRLATLLALALAACGGASHETNEPPCSSPARFYTAAVGDSGDGANTCIRATAAPRTWVRAFGRGGYHARVELREGDYLEAFTCDDTRDEPELEQCEGP